MRVRKITFYQPHPLKPISFECAQLQWADGAVFVFRGDKCVFASNLPYAVEF